MPFIAAHMSPIFVKVLSMHEATKMAQTQVTSHEALIHKRYTGILFAVSKQQTGKGSLVRITSTGSTLTDKAAQQGNNRCAGYSQLRCKFAKRTQRAFDVCSEETSRQS
jgi:hypothetical protein